MMAAVDTLLPRWEESCQESSGPLGQQTGAVCDPGWMLAQVLQIEHLVAGVQIPEDEFPDSLYGLVFE